MTLLSIGQTAQGRYKMIVAEGESIKGPIPQTGNTNTRCSFGRPVAAFVEQWCSAGPTHHFALGVGRKAAEIKRTAGMMGIEVQEI